MRAHAIAIAVLVVASAPAAAQTSVAGRADAVLRDMAARDLLQGAVVIGTRGRIDYAAGFGFADVGRRVPFTPDTPTDGASLAKTFTAAALLQLAAEGRVDLDAPVRDYVPEFPHTATRVRHLLSHSAGLPGYEALDAQFAPGTARTNAAHLAAVARTAPAPSFAPGSAFAYDNVAYDVAAMVIERASGVPYREVIDRRFAQPLQLALFVRPARLSDWSGPRTRGYRRSPAGWKDDDAFDDEGFHGGGNLYLSARDLQRWMAGYRSVIDAAAFGAAVAPARLDDGRATGLSLGSWYVSADRSRRYYIGHHNGFHNFGYVDDARGIAIAWVANDAPPPWLQVALPLALIAIAEGRAAGPLIAPPAAATVADPSGVYRVPQLGIVVISSEGERRAVRVNRVDYEAYPVGQGVRYVPGLDAYLRFTEAPDGGVTLNWDSVYLRTIAVRTAPAR